MCYEGGKISEVCKGAKLAVIVKMPAHHLSCTEVPTPGFQISSVKCTNWKVALDDILFFHKLNIAGLCRCSYIENQ